MAFTDIRGLALTSSSATAVEHFNNSIAANAEYRLSAGEHMAAAIEADPEFTMAHCVMGYYMMGAEVLVPEGSGLQCLLAAEATDLSRVTPRERASVSALRAWVDGRQEDAVMIWDRILDDHPTDLLTLQLAHYRNFWHGKAMAIRDSVARHLHAWDESMPNYSNVLGMYAFGLNETGDKVNALKYGERAMELNKDDLWSVHAVSHVLNDTGQQARGLQFLGQFSRDAWDDRNAIREHLWWHESLFEWELGNFEKVLSLFDEHVAKNVTSFYLDIQNTASILWRLESSGVDVGDRWKKLTDAAIARVASRNVPFTDAHLAMILGRSGEKGHMNTLLESVRGDTKSARNAREMSVAESDIAVCEAIDAYCNGDYDAAVELMLPGRWNAYRPLGASDAQRDVLSIMLGQAGLKAGKHAMATSVFAQRIKEKPSNQMSWLWFASALEQGGNDKAAKEARAKAMQYDGSLAA